MHARDFDLNDIRQWVLKASVDTQRLRERMVQTPQDHIGEPPVDPDWVEESST